MKLPTTKICQIYRGLDKGGGAGQRRIRYIVFKYILKSVKYKLMIY